MIRNNIQSHKFEVEYRTGDMLDFPMWCKGSTLFCQFLILLYCLVHFFKLKCVIRVILIVLHAVEIK